MSGLERNTQDRMWIARIKAGDEAALRELFSSYYRELSLFGRRYVSSPDLATDVLQDVFAGLWFQRDQLYIKTTVRGYLYSAVRHRCLNIRRHERVAERWREEQVASFDDFSPVAFPDVDLVVLAEAIEEAIAQLPPRAQEVFRMCRDDGLSHQEIAATIGISVNSVAVTMTRALKALHGSLKDWL